MNKARILITLALAVCLSACETTTVKNPDGTTTTTKTLPPAVAQSLATGAVVVTGALAERLADELKPKARKVDARVLAQK